MAEDNIDFTDANRPRVNPKESRCSKFRYSEPPLCYTQNTPKEELVLEHVIEYAKQFSLIYDDRELLLYPKNECGVVKFICTTLRPTKMAFLELYDHLHCAKFVANFLDYEELTVPNRFPSVIPSPTNILQWQAGDCFDFAMALTSLLIGAGYDAYFVYGKAPRYVTQKDQGVMIYEELEDLDNKTDEDSVIEVKEENEFRVSEKPVIESQFLRTNREQAQQERIRKEIQENTIDDDEPDVEPHDPWEGDRLHAWVLVKLGKRGVTEDVFLEPSTGRQYPTKGGPYISIDAIFNNQNFWINMNPNKEVDDLNLKFGDPNEWEFVMLDNQGKKKKMQDFDNFEDDADGGVDEQDEDEEEGDTEQVLDMPPPWAPRLKIDYDAYRRTSPLAEYSIFYKKCRVDIFAEYTQCDGLVRRITIYSDYKRTVVKEIRCYYAHRVDRLHLRRRFPIEHKTIEEYLPGSDRHLKHIKTLIEIEGRYRKIIFHPNRTKPGLVLREEKIKEKITEYYEGRDDRIVERSIKFRPAGGKKPKDPYVIHNHSLNGEIIIEKMTEKFAKNEEIPNEDQIAKIVFNIEKGKIFVYNHFKKGKITAEMKEFSREGGLGMAKLPDMADKEHVESKKYQEKQKILSLEKEFFTEFRNEEGDLKNEMEEKEKFENQIIKYRNAHDIEEALHNQVLEKTIYDKAREKSRELGDSAEDQGDKDGAQVDYLAAVIERLGYGNRQLSYHEAMIVKSEVLNKLKERLLARAEIIQRRLEEETKKVNEKMQIYQRKADQATEEEQRQYDQFLDEANFRTEILTQRAARHEEMAMQKYAKMDQDLMNDPRLAALSQKTKK
eukprot:CAMPEP_0114983882 /NCGR_PEP_ID=MMETSP0216-20121206/6955_1 /TAXON_ID=223996 /ORGANISM="Protocruzia adherens, Strain Boccale" /LENGTH=833 /DNA_ID=CAMNT_0002345931 /DNA_START=33 /DNA_END=2534 /DNA_ORIENTATION=+